MIRHTVTNGLMECLSNPDKDWSTPYVEWDKLYWRDKRAKKDLARLESIILENDYAELESASLRLDKFTHIGDKNSNIDMQELKKIAECSEKNKMTYSEDRQRLLNSFLALPNAVSITGSLGSRMMVNHAGCILENAGMALHPLFSFPVIPGSALKGIARHHAWESWRQAVLDGNQSEAESLAHKIARVFGFPTGDKPSKEEVEKKDFIREYLDIFGDKLKFENCSGSIDFIQAMPSDDRWKLTVDIVNPHGGNDYTDPIPSFFLAVEKGASFTFILASNALAKDDDMDFARKHLMEGLSESGIGAKTAAGYGWFDFNASCENDSVFANLKLVTPAFLGGADWQRQEDTNLRVPSLRGLLRWWWRTLYRSWLNDEELKKLETAVWGNDKNGSQISLQIVEAKQQETLHFNVKDRFYLKQDYANRWGIDPQNNGLLYMAYGMAEEGRIRTCLLPGAEWKLRVSTRNRVSQSMMKDYGYVSSEKLKEQAQLALSLLCKFGGIGSKSRHGFGSLSWDGTWDLQTCQEKAFAFLQMVYPERNLVERNVAYSWTTAIQESLSIPVANAWTAIDRLGMAIKGFASQYKHRDEKAVLGLPRKIHGPMKTPLKHQLGKRHQPPENLELQGISSDSSRFASPVWYHLGYKDDSHMIVNMTAFPSSLARSLATSQKMLGDLLKSVKAYLENLQPQKARAAMPIQQRTVTKPPAANVYAGDKVKVVLLEEKTKKGGWKVKHDGLGIGSIQHSEDVPADKKPGDEVEVVVAIAKTGGQAQFLWIKS